jgi:predicted nucleic acid-binding protein
MKIFLLDTNILIDWYSNGPSQGFLGKVISEEKDFILTTSWICAAEFLCGADSIETKFFLKAIESGEVSLYIENEMDSLLEISLLRKKTLLKLPDSIILYHAKIHRAIILTRDVDFYRRGKKVYSHMILASA